MNLNQLRVFHAVAQTQGFTRAAGLLHLTQPGISKHVKELEMHYSTRLFDRLGKKVVLTEAGEVLFATTKRIFRLLDDAAARITDLDGSAVGRLHVGASLTIGTYILPPMVAEFCKKYKKIDVSLDIDLSGRIVEKLLNNKLDVGLIGASVSHAALEVSRFREDNLLLIVPSDHSWTAGEAVQVRELQDERFLVPGKDSGTRTIVEERLREVGVILSNIMEFGNNEGVKRAVQAGLGPAIVSETVARSEIDSGRIASIDLEGINLKRSLYTARLKDKYATNAVRLFLDLLTGSALNFNRSVS